MSVPPIITPVKPGTLPFRPDAPIVAELSAGAVVVHEPSGEFLLIHLADEDRWCLPKGHVDPGESLQQAARREIAEETGLDPVELREEIGEIAYRFYRPREESNVLKISVYFLAYTATRSIQLEPLFDRSSWLAPEEAVRTVTYDTDRTILAHARDRVRCGPSSGRGAPIGSSHH